MNSARTLLLVLSLVLLEACSSHSPKRVKVATLRNQAEALYAYGGVARFPLSSDVAEVTLYAPAGAIPPGAEAGKPEEEAPSPDREVSSAGTIRVKRVAASGWRTASAGNSYDAAARLDPGIRISYSQPHLRLSSKGEALIGKPFDCIVEFENTTPLDLSSVGVVVLLDSRIQPLTERIEADESLNCKISWEQGQLFLLFPDGVERRKSLRVVVPVVIPTTAVRIGPG